MLYNVTNTTLTVSFVLFSSFAHALCDRKDETVGSISQTKSYNKRKLNNSGVSNPLLDNLTSNTSGHFTHFYDFSWRLRGLERHHATCKMSGRIKC